MSKVPPFSYSDAKKLMKRLMTEGCFVSPLPGSHARQEMDKDGLTDQDIMNVVRGGTVDETRPGNGGRWRYRIGTPRMQFVMVFDPEPDFFPEDDEDVSEIELIVVSGWRIRP